MAGDSNIKFDSAHGKEIILWLIESFHLRVQYSNNLNIPTTLNNTDIDAIFYRGCHLESYIYIYIYIFFFGGGGN